MSSGLIFRLLWACLLLGEVFGQLGLPWSFGGFGKGFQPTVNQKMPQGSPELPQAPMQMPQAPANVPPAPVSQAQAEMLPPQAQMPPGSSNLAWRFGGFSGGFAPPVNQKMPQDLPEVPQAPVQMLRAPAKEPPALVSQAQAEMPPAQPAPSHLAWRFGGFSGGLAPPVNQKMPQHLLEVPQAPVQMPPAPVSQAQANMPPAQAEMPPAQPAPSNLAWQFGGFSSGFTPSVNRKMPQGSLELPQAPMQMPQAPANVPPAPVRPAQPAPSNLAQMPQAPVQKPPMLQAPAEEPPALVSQAQAEMPPPQAQMPPAQAAPSNLAWRFGGFSSGFAPPVNQKMPQGPLQMPQAPVQKPPMPQAPMRRPQAPANVPPAPVSQAQAKVPPAQPAPSNPAWHFHGFAPPVNQKMPQGPPQMPQAPVQKPPMPQAPMRRPQAPANVPPAPVSQAQAQMPPAQPAPSHPAGGDLGSSSVNGVGEAAFTDGDSESPTPEQERYLVLTAPSGFQTRYVVKSFNRYVRGKRVFSQTTYIPLDIPPPPSAPIDQPAPVSNPGHEAQTVEVTPAKKG